MRRCARGFCGPNSGLTFVERQLGFGAAASSNAEIWLPAAATVGAQTLVAFLRSEDQRLATA